MDWFVGMVSSILAIVFGFLPNFSQEHRYVAMPAMTTRQDAVVLFAGDMMFDRSIRVEMQKNGEDFIFSCLGTTLKKPDLTVANLEGPITERASKSVGSKPGDLSNTRFTFASSTAALLKRQGIDAVSLANNHAQDFGADGVRSTTRFLEGTGVAHFGDPLGERMHVARVNRIPLAFIGHNEFQTLVGEEWKGSTTTTEKARKARADGYFPIVYAHWGAEYVPAGPEAKRLAREWIDAGAEMVIGAHPHVIQEHEEYAGKHIYYSLGNFIFDQYFQEDVRNGLLLEITFDHNGFVSAKEIPVYLERDRRTCLKAQ